jgi:hypothetical protein
MAVLPQPAGGGSQPLYPGSLLLLLGDLLPDRHWSGRAA